MGSFESVPGRALVNQWMPAAIGGVVLILCLVAAGLFVRVQVKSALEIEVDSIHFEADELSRGAIVVRAIARNGTGFGATYEGMDAELTVAGRDSSFTVEGIQKGDFMVGGASRELIVRIPFAATDLLAGGLQLATSGKVEVVISGDVQMSVFGIGQRVPFQFSRGVKLWKPRVRGG
jgi:hypothetical protein